MGLCFSRGDAPPPKRRQSKRITNHSADGSLGSSRWARIRSSRKEENLIHERALAAAILFQQQMQGGGGVTAPFDRSTSLRYPNGNSRRSHGLPRSSSTRARSLTDPLLQPHQLVSQDSTKLENLETNHFVLVHGGGFGAWCWYKTIALLEEVGYKVTAVDLTGSGIHSCDSNSIASLSQYAKPLTDFMEGLTNEKVILVGHDFGGACISYAMEMFPSKVSKAVFLAAAMLTSGQSTLDMFSEKVESNDLMQRSQIFLYANGNNQSPTAIDYDKSLLRDLLFNQSPAKDIALASVSMRPIPFSPVLEKLSLSETKHGSVRRFYIETLEDNAIPLAVQEGMVNKSPPEQVFHLKGADHAPFFSKPQALHRILVEISRIP
ncbi:methyl esterase 11 [Striga asiatica]|uniref:Methyl esterase 11 n=1 Tax=Striga asiatica TaxID=4170 RepID=A0A5A7QWJ7_STRAF|nr:methyl esterase 11 [Striga asiatica]